MATEQLTHPAVQGALRKAKGPQPRKKLFDGRGLFLLITPADRLSRPKFTAYWRLKHRVS